MKTIQTQILIISFAVSLMACTNKEKINLQKECTDNLPSMNDASKANLSAGRHIKFYCNHSVLLDRKQIL